jgi:hypothetical protein
MSQMQLVHAFDMQEMSMPAHHAMTGMKHSIFCETSPNTKDAQCAKEIIPDKLLSQPNNEEVIQSYSFVLPITFTASTVIIEEPLIPGYPHSPPDLFFEKTKYASLVGIIKNVN